MSSLDTGPAAATRAADVARHSLARAGILVPFLILFIVLSLTSSSFATKANLLNILDQQSATLIIAAAGTLVLVSGGIDLSVGAVYGFAAVVSAHFALDTDPGARDRCSASAPGCSSGSRTAIVTTVFRINSLIATLGDGVHRQRLRRASSRAATCSSCSTSTDFGDLARTEFLTVKTSIWLMIVAVLVLGLLLATTTAGRYMYAAGGNAEAARLAGRARRRIRMLTFALSGAAAGLAGVIDTSRVLSAQASTRRHDPRVHGARGRSSSAARASSAAKARSGGRVVGVLFIALIGNGYPLLSFDPLYEQITMGALLLLAVGLDALSRRK